MDEDDKAGYTYETYLANDGTVHKCLVFKPCEHPNLQSGRYHDYCPDCGYSQGY